jgi:hypothetical protein
MWIHLHRRRSTLTNLQAGEDSDITVFRRRRPSRCRRWEETEDLGDWQREEEATRIFYKILGKRRGSI